MCVYLLVPFEFLLSIFEPEDGSADVLTVAAADDPQKLLPPPPLVGGVPVDRTSALSLASIKQRRPRNTNTRARKRLEAPMEGGGRGGKARKN